MLIKKGAEADLFLAEWQNRKIIMKHRVPKKYRIPEIDHQIRYQRTIHESQMIHQAKEAGTLTPTIFMIDLVETTIIMEFIEGLQIKQVLNNVSPMERFRLSYQIGESIGNLHKYGIVHGDLTTSNLIVTSDKKIFFVDFGLSEKSRKLESRGVDLHLMKRALQSTHYTHAKESFEAVLKGYGKVMGAREANNVSMKIREIERRGRYISER